MSLAVYILLREREREKKEGTEGAEILREKQISNNSLLYLAHKLFRIPLK